MAENVKADDVEETSLRGDEFLADPDEGKGSDTETTHTDLQEEIEEQDDGVKSAFSRKRPPEEYPTEGKKAKVEVEEKVTEDVCFVCHDGGALVACDKRDCPKVYHTECIGVDVVEENKTWYCGRHYCEECNKPAAYHCVTCYRAYCPAHFRTADFTVLKKKLGLCFMCLPQVRLIEGGDVSETGDSEIEVKEILFRDYWLNQRSKLGLSLPKTEGARQLRSSAQAPAAAEGEQAEGDEEGSAATDDLGADDDATAAAPAPAERRKFDSWASPELLAFLGGRGHDVSKALPRDDVEKAVWDHVREKGLQAPDKPAEIRCDEALEKLLRRKTVGRLAMLRILQEQFSGSLTQRGVSGRRLQKGPSAGKGRKVTKRLTRTDSKKKKSAAATSKDAEDGATKEQYAAISRKNIELLYIRRSLLESLVESPDFERVVLGAFVRIKTIAIDNPTKAAYRLVPVIGFAEGTEYTFGRKPTKRLLKVQNLSKVEDTLMDTLSSQDFDEDEMARLWRATKVAEVFQPMTVGHVEAKAREILPFRVDEAMEAEKQKLINLRDRASELGEMKELKRIVEQLKEVERPETRAGRLSAPLGIEADPKMDPAVPYDPEAEEREKKEKEAQQRAAEQKKATAAPVKSPRNRRDDRTSRWGPAGRGSDPPGKDDRRKGADSGLDKRRPIERAPERSRERSRERERERGRRSPYQGGRGGPRDRDIVSPRDDDRRKESGPDRRGGGERFNERPPRASRFDEPPPRGGDSSRPGISPRFGGDRPRDRERGPSNDRPGNGFERKERTPPFGPGFLGPPGNGGRGSGFMAPSGGGGRGGPPPREGPGRSVVRDARDLPLLQTPPTFAAPVRPPMDLGALHVRDPSKNRQPFAGPFDNRPSGNRPEYGKYDAPRALDPPRTFEPQRSFEPPPAVTQQQQGAPPTRTPPLHTDTAGYRGFGDRSGVRPPFRSGQPPPIAPLPIPAALPPAAPAPAAVPVPPYVPPPDPKWHYRDPQGVQQGPFTLAQLKKWQATGAFPSELKVWMENRPESSAVLLTSILATEAGRPSQPAPSQAPAAQVGGTFQSRTPAEPARTATPPVSHERPEATRFGGTSRWEPAPGGPRNNPQPSYGASARPNETASGVQGYQGEVRGPSESTFVSRDYAPRPSEGDRVQSSFGRANGGRGPPANFARAQDEGDRWKGNPLPRGDVTRGQFDAAPRRNLETGPGGNVAPQYRGQPPAGGSSRDGYEERAERPYGAQGPPGSMHRPKQNRACMYFAKGYCVKGDTCDFLHQR
ncbi:RNA polymerase I transcription factor UAF [Klebsormidium nitens]|uniref:RNA polymerase I transcription factor UAF n=1 Tax=Klebsormidium nitens TaxID=105231 RepID=A0A1Y1I353_KLENI|nr:RNA polymerase I transcription factor UAF [Klebsormidium nitens]|eukprot:GAQ83611.1 RNA polymerase I transcription factor UAF [Klebsormidium nitens]